MKVLANDNQIVSIEIHGVEPSETIVYRDEEINFWGKIVVEEGIYEKKGTKYPTFTKLEHLPNNFTLNNERVLEKPHIIFEYSNGQSFKKHFNNEDEINVYLKREFQGREWRIIE